MLFQCKKINLLVVGSAVSAVHIDMERRKAPELVNSGAVLGEAVL